MSNDVSIDEEELLKYFEAEDSKSDEPLRFDEMPSTSKGSFKDQFGVLMEEFSKKEIDKFESSKNESAKSSGISYCELGKGSSLIVNSAQKGNPLLDLIKGVPWKFSSISLPMDYIMSSSSCCIFLSLRYHALKPNYVYNKVKLLKNTQSFSLKVLLCLVDVKDCQNTINDLTSLCLIFDMTLLLAFSNAEAATYLETFKAYENKPVDSLKRQQSANTGARSVEVLSSIMKINSTDGLTLISNFESLANVISANKKDLGCCPGIGGLKADILHDLFRQPFLKSSEPSSST